MTTQTSGRDDPRCRQVDSFEGERTPRIYAVTDFKPARRSPPDRIRYRHGRQES